jgi:hypothetical protein
VSLRQPPYRRCCISDVPGFPLQRGPCGSWVWRPHLTPLTRTSSELSTRADDSGIDHMAYLSATSSADLMASP